MQRHFLVIVLAAMLLAVVVLFLGQPDPAIDARLYGKWRIESTETAWLCVDEIVTPDSSQERVFHPDGSFDIYVDGELFEGHNKRIYKVNTSRNPNVIDIATAAEFGEGGGLGIYSIKGDTMIICQSVVDAPLGTRPRHFKAEGNWWLFRMRRVAETKER